MANPQTRILITDVTGVARYLVLSVVGNTITVSDENTGSVMQLDLGFIATGHNTGDQDLSGYVSKATRVNGHLLDGPIDITSDDVGLGNVRNVDNTNADNLSSGTVASDRLPTIEITKGGTGATTAAAALAALGAAAVTQSAWIAPTLINAWVNTGGTRAAVAYYKDTLGNVHIKGDAKSGGTPILFVLPVGYRPAEDLVFAALTTSTGASAYVVVYPNGDVAASTTGAAGIIMNISFRP